jgi:hypothetical protein
VSAVPRKRKLIKHAQEERTECLWANFAQDETKRLHLLRPSVGGKWRLLADASSLSFSALDAKIEAGLQLVRVLGTQRSLKPRPGRVPHFGSPTVLCDSFLTPRHSAMRGILCMRGHSPHDRVDASFIRVTSEDYGLYPTHAQTSCARIALLREFELARCKPCFAYIVVPVV